MGSVSLQGQLIATQQLVNAGGCAGGAAGMQPFAFGLSQAQKAFNNATGVLVRTIVSPSAYVELSAVGDGADVPLANVFAITSQSPALLRLTFADDSVSVIPIYGVFLVETDPTNAIKLVEFQGTSLITYFASGN